MQKYASSPVLPTIIDLKKQYAKYAKQIYKKYAKHVSMKICMQNMQQYTTPHFANVKNLAETVLLR